MRMPDARLLKQRLHDAFNRHDLDEVIQCHSQDAVLVTPAGVAEGHEQIASYYDDLFRGFPDMRMTVWHTVLCTDPAVTEWLLIGTHTGPFLLPGGQVLERTGRHVAVRGTSTCSVGNDKIISHRMYFDQLELYTQLGGRLAFDEQLSPCERRAED
ncbi:ester cyclase [Microbispora rosea]|uniref:ester cyclase n=1 Tax=Microbispora rosea TaxID=58117 RepID=UPI003D8B0215